MKTFLFSSGPRQRGSLHFQSTVYGTVKHFERYNTMSSICIVNGYKSPLAKDHIVKLVAECPFEVGNIIILDRNYEDSDDGVVKGGSLDWLEVLSFRLAAAGYTPQIQLIPDCVSKLVTMTKGIVKPNAPFLYEDQKICIAIAQVLGADKVVFGLGTQGQTMVEKPVKKVAKKVTK